MARLVPAIPMFGTYPLDTLVRGYETISDALHSDDEDDSTRPSQPSSWDGWHIGGSAASARPCEPPDTSTKIGPRALTPIPDPSGAPHIADSAATAGMGAIVLCPRGFVVNPGDHVPFPIGVVIAMGNANRLVSA